MSETSATWYGAWMSAETAYAQLLATIVDQAQGGPSRAWALELARVRAQADQARDKYFKQTL